MNKRWGTVSGLKKLAKYKPFLCTHTDIKSAFQKKFACTLLKVKTKAPYMLCKPGKTHADDGAVAVWIYPWHAKSVGVLKFNNSGPAFVYRYE